MSNDEPILVAELNYQGHYDDQHEPLVELLGEHFDNLEQGHQGDSWIWLTEGDSKVEIDTFQSMHHQVKTCQPNDDFLKRIIHVLETRYSVTIHTPIARNERRKAGIHQLLKGLETGKYDSVEVIHPEVYIQHNPQTREGRDGLAQLFKEIAKTNPRVNLVRTFSDGDYVFAHTEYDFATRRIGFEVFRFEGEYTVEHWDNIQPRLGPNPSGHSMVDGETEVIDLELTETNRQLLNNFISNVLISHQLHLLGQFIHTTDYVEHNPELTDDIGSLEAYLLVRKIDYQRHHRTLAEGNFVLTVCEGYRDDVHTAFYDLFRLQQGKIVEHWDTTEAVPDLSQWQNDNGKF